MNEFRKAIGSIWKIHGNHQSHVDFARDLPMELTRRRCAFAVNTFEELCELMVLEQLKETLPEAKKAFVTTTV